MNTITTDHEATMIVPVSGKIIGQLEREYMHAAVDEGWLTSGKWCAEFEKRLRAFTGKREVVLCNSGSSANLLAMCAAGIGPGDEVITTALNFPTTVNPIVQLGGVPVFVDVTLPEMVVDVSQLEAALSDKTKAVIFAHTLGYPFDVKAVRAFCDAHGLVMIEDCCDALGTEGIMYGDFNTLSFYPAHHITTGEGGAILTDSPANAKLLRSFRDWGRDCWCETGRDNTCGRRFAGDYDHKYQYSHRGYNLKMGDIAAACGCAQMERLRLFVGTRFAYHYHLLVAATIGGFWKYFDYGTNVHVLASYFGFALICKPPLDRNALCRYLDSQGVHNRPVFAGNITRQPAYKDVKYRVIGGLPNTEIVHDRAFWIGCWPGLTTEQLDYAVDKIKEYVEKGN